ncbi:hypothetical protein [Enterovirga sp.]|uniref:hypothetical protein n=1 Tax=Enterovirga sp. TaxID=2026350 RepID=UPI002CAE2575|nr:hypothetical protein [Enterovirga sp.]HMO28388.1 hypothetical protein [Enterovirga sp.]
MRSLLVLSGFVAAFCLAAATLSPTPASAGPGVGGGYKDQVKSGKKRRKSSEAVSAVAAG